jgi:predicted DNA-binding ArsR family transcriptional regulator
MKAKEYALKLYHKFFQEIPAHPVFDDRVTAKNCALHCVDEILKVAFYADDEIYNYYLEVKQEIENL